MHARSFLTTLALGYLTLGAEAKCRHSKSRTLASVTTTATVTASPSGFTTILTGSSSSSTGNAAIDSAVTTTTTTTGVDDDDAVTTTTASSTTPVDSVSTTTSPTTTSPTTIPTPEPVFNPIYTPDSTINYHVGDSVDITWDYDPYYAGLITIKLIGGIQQNTQQYLGTLVAGIDNSLKKWTWKMDQSFLTGEFEFYGLSIELQGTDKQQYSMPLNIFPAGVNTRPVRPAATKP